MNIKNMNLKRKNVIIESVSVLFILLFVYAALVSMIDVYAVADGKYQFSFYLPDFRGFKVRDFKVYGQSLYALYDHYLYKYQLNF